MNKAGDILKVETSAKLPPQNLEAEASLLGSLLIDQEAIVKVADLVTPEDFYIDKHNLIYTAVIDLYEQHQPIDLLTVSNKLEELKALNKIGGSAYLTDLVNMVPTAAHAVHYAGIVAHKATLRRLISAASKITNLGYDENSDVEVLLDQAEQTLFGVSQKRLQQNFLQINSILAESFDRLDELHKDKNKLRGVSTGFKTLDNILAGFQKSDLIVLASRPSMGKTSLALNIAHNIASKKGIPVGIFSLEMSKEQLIDRLLAAESGIDAWKLRTGHLEDSDFPKLNNAMAQLSEAPFFIDDSPLTNIMEMRTKARKLQSEHDLGLLIVDYLQLMSSRGSFESRVQEVSEISRGLKALARELNIPVLACSQLSRAVETRSPQIPQLADLRESGSIEQDADVVMFIYREDYYNPETDRANIADILIKKHRNGPTGQTELYWHPERLLFDSVDRSKVTS